VWTQEGMWSGLMPMSSGEHPFSTEDRLSFTASSAPGSRRPGPADGDGKGMACEGAGALGLAGGPLNDGVSAKGFRGATSEGVAGAVGPAGGRPKDGPKARGGG